MGSKEPNGGVIWKLWDLRSCHPRPHILEIFNGSTGLNTFEHTRLVLVWGFSFSFSCMVGTGIGSSL